MIKLTSNRILNICAGALLLQSFFSPLAFGQQSFLQKTRSTATKFIQKGAQKLGAPFSRAMEHVGAQAKEKLSQAYTAIRSYDRTALFETISRKLTSAGQQIQNLTNCALTGKECSAEQIVLIGTASFIFIGLLVLAGTSITIAARSKLVEDAKKDAIQKTEGSAPQTKLQRLAQLLNKGKQKFTSLKEGIITGKLTKDQRNFLIGFGATLIGLTIVVVGTLTGLALYAQQKEKKAEAFRTTVDITPTATTTLAEIPKPIAHQSPTAAAKELAKPVILGGIAAATGAAGKLFDTVIRVDETGSNIFQRTYKTVKEKLEEKVKYAQQALQAADEKKEELVQKAKKAYEDAINAANSLIAETKNRGGDLINETLKALFNIDYDDVKEGIRSFNVSLQNLTPKLNTLNTIPTWNHLTRVQNNWNAVQTKGYALWNNLTQFLTQLASRKKEREGWWGYFGYGTREEESKEKRAELLKKYPLAFKFDALVDIYPRLIQSVAQTDVVAAGKAAQETLEQSGTMLESIANIYSNSGIWGKLLLDKSMIKPLNEIGAFLKEIGNNLKEFTDNEPLAQLTAELPQTLENTPLKEWFSKLIWQPQTTISTVKDIMNVYSPQIMKANEQLSDALQKTTDLSNTFAQHSTNMTTLIQQTIKEELAKKPFQNYLNVAKQAVAKEAQISKELFNDVLLYAAGIVNYLEKMISPFTIMIERINGLLGSKLITDKNIEILKEITEKLRKMLAELAKLRMAAKRTLSI